jgi:hypothetical protein
MARPVRIDATTLCFDRTYRADALTPLESHLSLPPGGGDHFQMFPAGIIKQIGNFETTVLMQFSFHAFLRGGVQAKRQQMMDALFVAQPLFRKPPWRPRAVLPLMAAN